MKNISVRQLRYLEALAQCCHFGKAAERCRISQPALSMQIKALEDELGLMLIERKPGGVVLTPKGEEVLRRAEDILSRLEDLSEYAQIHEKPLTGPLKFGVIPTIGPYVLPSLLSAVTEQFPALQLMVRESQTAHLVADLLEYRLDLALLALPLGEDRLDEMPLGVDEFVLVVPQGHALAKRTSIGQEQLAGTNMLLLEEGHCLRDQALSFCTMIGKDGISEFGATSLATLVGLVVGGHGVTLLPQMAVPAEISSRTDIATIAFAEPKPERVVGLVWRKNSPRAREFELFGETVRSLL